VPVGGGRLSAPQLACATSNHRSSGLLPVGFSPSCGICAGSQGAVPRRAPSPIRGHIRPDSMADTGERSRYRRIRAPRCATRIAAHAEPAPTWLRSSRGRRALVEPGVPGLCGRGSGPQFPEPEHSGHRVALEHKRAVAGRLRERAVAAGARDPDKLAEELLLVMDGTRSIRSGVRPREPRPACGRGVEGSDGGSRR
jgi:hypothetical protein